MSQMNNTIQNSLDKFRRRFLERISDRLSYHAGGDPVEEWEYLGNLNFYGMDVEVEMGRALANEIDQKIRDGMRVDDSILFGQGNLIQPVEIKLILPEPPVPVHKSLLGSLTQEDIKRWKYTSGNAPGPRT